MIVYGFPYFLLGLKKSFKQFSQIHAWHQICMYFMLFNYNILLVISGEVDALMLAAILSCTPSVFLWQEGKFRNKWCNSWAKCYFTAKNKPKHCNCRDEAFSECFIRTCTAAQFRLGMDKKNKTKRAYKLLGFIGVLSGTGILHEGHRQLHVKLEPTLLQVRVSNSIQIRIWKTVIHESWANLSFKRKLYSRFICNLFRLKWTNAFR